MNTSVLPYRRLVAALFGTLKVMQMYGRRHDATVDAVRNLGEAIHAAADEGETRIGVRGKRVQVNGRTMRASECGSLALTFLASEWTKRGIECVRMLPDVTAHDVEEFSILFIELDLTSPEPAQRLDAAVRDAGCHGITIEAARVEEHDPIVLEERRATAMRSYLRGLRAFKAVLRCDGLEDRKTLRRARRAVQGIVDRFMEDETAVLALAQIQGHDRKLFRHSLNVCIHALLIGQRLGLSRRQLGELGLAALFHDLGKTADEATEQHPARGALMILKESSTHEGMLKAAIAAYEHHAGAGLPTLEHAPHLVSRIVAIADCYEALTRRETEDDAEPRAPHEALNLMQRRAGTLFDPVLLKVFVNALGLYPVGALVQLSTGEVAIVAEGPRGDRPDLPQVKILLTATGRLEAEQAIDLAETLDDGQPVRHITRTLEPHEVFGSVGEYVSAI